MYLKYPKENKTFRLPELIDPLNYLDRLQKDLNLKTFKAKNIPFEKQSRICRNNVIQDIANLTHKYQIYGYFWGLMAARPVYYFYPLLSQLEGFYNFDHCSKQKFKFLNNQMQTLQRQFPLLDIRAFNKDIFDVIQDTNKDLPSIIELDGMKTLDNDQVLKIIDLINKLPNRRNLVAITSTIGRVPGFTQEYYENIRNDLVNTLQLEHFILEHKSIEYAEQTHQDGPHYPMRVEIFVFGEH